MCVFPRRQKSSGFLYVIKAEGNSYTYSGDRVSTFTPFGQSAVYFTHDSRGRMTYDGASGVTIDYNYLNLTRKISGTGGTLAKYSYLANGSKTEAENGSGAGLVYRGSLIYKKASNGTLTLEGANLPEGRLLPGARRLYVTDHLGSAKAVVNGNNGNLYEVNYYTVYGKQSANSSANSYISTAPSGEKFRQHFTGKEDQAPDFTVPFTDFGARQYSPALRRWLVPDPLSEKYYGISPYAYCAGDPVNLVDPDGKSTDEFVFDTNGRFVERREKEGKDVIIVQGENKEIEINFVDPVNDPKTIRPQTTLVTPAYEDIINALNLSGATSKDNHGFLKGLLYLATHSDGGKNSGELDFITRQYIPLDTDNHFYISHKGDGDYYAHNAYNYGNFLWGAASNALGVPLGVSLLGAHMNNYFFDYKYKGHLDSLDDQLSIMLGYFWYEETSNTRHCIH